MLDDAVIDALEDLLFDDRWADTALDYYGFHGAVTANCVAPQPLPLPALLAVVLGCDPAEITSVPAAFETACEQLSRALCCALDLDEQLALPPAASESVDESVAHWCIGFAEVHLANEDAWMTKDPDQTVHRLTPILTLSGMFSEDNQHPPKPSSRLYKQLLQAIPEAVKDLYLQFHA